jgi:S-adenosylmethionine-diacylglycerol 3-amino-3-carboxypropyl transferase
MDWLTGSRAKELAVEWQSIWDRSTPDCKILWRSLGIKSDYVDEVVIRIEGNAVRLVDILEYDLATAQRIRDSERVTAYGSTCLAHWRIRVNR